MGKFKPDLTDPVATAKGWSRRQQRAAAIDRLVARNEELETEAVKDYVRINCSREEIERLTAIVDAQRYDLGVERDASDKRLAKIKELEEEAELYVKAQQAQPTICAHFDGGWVWTNCPACGPNVALDEEGCCKSCGRDGLWYGKAEEAKNGSDT